ncbi:transposase [Veronia nyctiphanis]|uniref:Transposase n=1 Tax=Veronia nyctiphanis TaxID=1278244 RepID=A0A4Q0YTK6_9GAMM|nr:recombinase family protein [Veronia nyctiphanis]RXJ74560.1 transposase [Veronia nyctiphanis]
MKIGYARVASKWYQTELQVAKLESLGCDKIWKAHNHQNLTADQEFSEFLVHIRKGDTVVATSLLAVAETKSDLLSLLNKIEIKGAYFLSIEEPWCDTTPGNAITLKSILQGVIDFELAVAELKQTSDISYTARAVGVAVGRPSKLDEEMKLEAISLLKAGKTAAEIGRLLGVSRSTISRLKRDFALDRE